MLQIIQLNNYPYKADKHMPVTDTHNHRYEITYNSKMYELEIFKRGKLIPLNQILVEFEHGPFSDVYIETEHLISVLLQNSQYYRSYVIYNQLEAFEHWECSLSNHRPRSRYIRRRIAKKRIIPHTVVERFSEMINSTGYLSEYYNDL